MNKKFCTSCGTENIADAKFCKKCGQAIREKVEDARTEKKIEKPQPETKKEVKTSKMEETKPDKLELVREIDTKKVDYNGMLNTISDSLANPPYSVITNMMSYMKYLKDEVGETENVDGQAISFFMTMGDSVFTFLSNQMQTFPTVVDLMTTKKKNILDTYGVSAGDEADRIESFVFSFNMKLMRETMNRGMSSGSDKSYSLIISLIVYFSYKYPALTNQELFNTLKDSEKERLKKIGTAVDSLIYRFKKDINPDNEPIPDQDKFILYGVQKFLVGISLKLPQIEKETGFQQGTVFETIRAASHLNRIHQQRTKMIVADSKITAGFALMEAVKSIECLVDLNKWLWENKGLSEDEVIEGLEYCNRSIQESYDKLPVWVKQPCNSLLDRWISENFEGISGQKNPSDKEYASICRSYKILTGAAMGGRDFVKENKHLLEKASEIYSKVLKNNMDKAFSGLGTEYLETAPIFHILSLQYSDNIDKLREEIDSTLALYESSTGMYNRLIYVSRAPILKAGEDLKNQELQDLAMYISDKMVEETESEEVEVSLKDLEEHHFREGVIDFQTLPSNIFTILGDTNVSDKVEMQFYRIRADTKTQTLTIHELSLKDLTSKLPFNQGKVADLSYDMNNQSTLLDGQGLLAVVTKDKDNNLDGLLFSLQVTIEDVEASTTIHTPQGTRAGAPRKLTIQEIETVHLYGIAKSEGPLGKQEITLQDYLKKLVTEGEIKIAKLYHLKVPGGMMSIVKFD